MVRQASKEVFQSTKKLIVENQRERSLGAQRLIVDHVRSVGGITKVEIIKELLHGYLDEEK